jgi:hypothetical protein
MAAPRTRTAAPPMTIPAIAPVDKDWPDDALWVDMAEGAAADVLVDVDEVEDGVDDIMGMISEGKYFPGLNINVACLRRQAVY